MKAKKTYSTQEIADLAKVSKSTILNWIKEGKVPEPTRNDKGWRVFSEADLKKIRAMKGTLPYITETVVISFTNQKGGCGKTTSSINVGAYLAMQNYNVLMIDMDAQAHTTKTFIEDFFNLKWTIFNVMIAQLELKEVILPTNYGNLNLAPSNITLATVDPYLYGSADGFYRLNMSIEKLNNDADCSYDFIIIDTPPTLGLATQNALIASDYVVIPIESSYFALEGTDDLLNTIIKIRNRANTKLDILGAVITLHDHQTILANDVKRKLEIQFGNKLFNTCIRKNVRLKEAPASGESIFTYAEKSSGAADYKSLTLEILQRLRKEA